MADNVLALIKATRDANAELAHENEKLILALRRANDRCAELARRIQELEGDGNVRQGKVFGQGPSPATSIEGHQPPEAGNHGGGDKGVCGRPAGNV